MSITERFLKYVSYWTTSDESTHTTPSTARQWDLAHYLEQELKSMGLEVDLDDKGYLMATLPANTTAKKPTIGFIAHMDTAPDASGENIKPRIVKNYDGNTYPLASSATFAAGYSNVFGDHGIEAECDFDYYFSGKKYSASAPVSISLGAAYTYHDIVTVRGGYHNGGLMGNYGSVGLGLKFFGVRLDAAYLLADKSSPVANTVNVGVGYCF